MNRKVHCKGCAFLVVAGEVEPACIATAVWFDGPLRQHIDVRGFVSALNRNLNNDCGLRKSISLKARAMRRFMLKDMSEVPLSQFPLDKEVEISENRRDDDSHKEGEDAEVPEEGDEAPTEDVSGEG